MDTLNSTTGTDAIGTGFTAALNAARQTLGATTPNPSVGCTLLDRAGNILTTAAHQRAGTPHAEPLALQKARDLGLYGQIDTALVTLEPCNHTGRTPPCTEALLASPARTIWVGHADPNPVASGGIARLRTAGRTVHLLSEHPQHHALAQDCAALIAPFARRVSQGSPWITIKQALTAEGSMIPPKGQNTFTSQTSLTRAHELRRATDAIITTPSTIQADTPAFTIRHVPDHPNRTPRLLVICSRTPFAPPKTLTQNFHILHCHTLAHLPTLLAEHNANWAMVEAGPTFLNALKTRNLWDDWLTIQQTPNAPDTLTIKTRTPFPSPTTFLFKR